VVLRDETPPPSRLHRLSVGVLLLVNVLLLVMVLLRLLVMMFWQ
jgi:hypothetical protein